MLETFGIVDFSHLDRRLLQDEIRTRIARIEGVLPDLRRALSPCSICPRQCSAQRSDGEQGECGLGSDLQVASVALHRGEEPPISGDTGAINVFFSGCNLHCIHCQNWPISQGKVGEIISSDELAKRIINKWRRGAHSLGWITPTAQIVPALEAYLLCLAEGVDLPLVYNCGGYEAEKTIRLLSGIVDVWLPDAKTFDSEQAEIIQGARDYPEVNLRALNCMQKQVKRGEARAVIVRHLVLPGALRSSRRVLETLWRDFGNNIYISLMGQYFPFYRAIDHEILGRRLQEPEYGSIVALAQSLGFTKGWVQHYDCETGISAHCL